MMHSIPDGIPLMRDYSELIRSEPFSKMENFSDGFLSAHKAILRKYTHKWVADPLHQWSRQWEYPYVYSKAHKLLQYKPHLSILDAGSGVTFFPYYLNALSDGINVNCCDYDQKLERVFGKINATRGAIVNFSTADLKDLPYETEAFDLVYCISVLEHTNDYKNIISEFYRVLRPGGLLVLTIDISLDGTRDIDLERATELLGSLSKSFDHDESLSSDLHAQVSIPGILTTLNVRDIDVRLLPWKLPSVLYRIKSFVVTKRFGSWPPLLTVFCLCATKRLP